MKTVKMEDILNNGEIRAEFLSALREGDIVIYPTDTVYGIGCIIEKEDSARKIAEAKGRGPEKPFSIIIPSIDWIKENCLLSDFNLDLLKQLFPGPYTAILRAKKESRISSYVLSKEHTLGIRMPKNKLADILRKENLIVISTSVNLSGKEPATKIENVPENIKNIASIAVDAGELKGPPSRIFDITTDKIEIIRS